MDDVTRGFYTVTKLSKNKYIDNDGMLVCKNAVLGKAGMQAYMGYELGLDSSDIIHVKRPEEEVFHDASLASLRGKTVTLNHPDEDVSVENHSELAKGFIMDVWREGNLIVGNIKITDKEAIDLIKDKKMVELSLGYEARLQYVDDNVLEQKDIVYNHLALVKKGRAEIARIVDKETKTRVLDKQFDEGEDLLVKKQKDPGLLKKFASLLGFNENEVVIKDEENKETNEEDTEDNENKEETEPVKTEDTSEKTENTKDNKEDNEDENQEDETVPVEDEGTSNTEDNEEPGDVKQETSEKEMEEEGESDEDMDLSKLKDQIEFIDSIKDEEMKKALREQFLDKLTENKQETQEQKDNSALDDFANIDFSDEDEEIEKVDGTAEIEKLYDELDPHNFDKYEDYVKYRKKLDKETKEGYIQGLVDKAIEGVSK